MMYVIGWTPATTEPEVALVPLAHSRTVPGVGEYNFGGYANAKVDAAIDKGRIEFDPSKRAAHFTEAMAAIDADAGFIPLVYRNIGWAPQRRDGPEVRERRLSHSPQKRQSPLCFFWSIGTDTEPPP